MLKGNTFWLLASLAMFVVVGCKLTPSSLTIGKDVLDDAGEVLESVKDTDADGEIGWRELLEGVVGSSFFLNWLRNRKYEMVPKLKSK